MEKIVMKLFITGQTDRSELAVENLTLICEELPGNNVIIIDVLDHPEMAENDGIMITPTLIKESPPPVRRIIGDLSDKKRVLEELDIGHKTEKSV